MRIHSVSDNLEMVCKENSPQHDDSMLTSYARIFYHQIIFNGVLVGSRQEAYNPSFRNIADNRWLDR